MGDREISSTYLHAKRSHILMVAGALIAAIALTDWIVVPNISLALFYLFPITLAAPVLNRMQIGIMALSCALLRAAFSPIPDHLELLRFSLVLLAFVGTGLFSRELAWSRKRLLEQERRLRERAEEQSWILSESTLAAVVMVDAQGKIVLANEAAHRLFGSEEQSLSGQALESFLPIPDLHTDVAAGPFSRRMVECTGRRRDGKTFFAQAWLSVYTAETGPLFTAIIFDASEELRDREQSLLQQQLMDSRVIMGTVWHEVRNFCGAMAVVQSSLKRVPELAQQEQIKTLGTLVEGLQKLVAKDVPRQGESSLEPVDLRTVLDELRIIVEPSLEQQHALVRWEIAADVLPVQADHHGLLQVFLNLAQNAHRALERVEHREFTVTAALEKRNVVVRFVNSGLGIPDPSRLFEPFQRSADAVGLGLYVSRAIVRAFGGDLRYIPAPEGCCFAVDLQVAAAKAKGVTV